MCAPSSQPESRRDADEVRRRADAITNRLLFSDEPLIDVEIAIGRLRDDVARRFPDKVWLFDVLYEARWQRLREQGWARERSAPW